MSTYQCKLREYHRLEESIEILNNEAIKEFETGGLENVENGKNLLVARDKLIVKIKKYKDGSPIATRDLRVVLYELLKQCNKTKEELEDYMKLQDGTFDDLICNGTIKLAYFNWFFTFFGIEDIKHKFIKCIKDYENIKCCPYCLSEDYYINTAYKGTCEYKLRFDGGEINRGYLLSNIEFENISDYARCSNCNKKLDIDLSDIDVSKMGV